MKKVNPVRRSGVFNPTTLYKKGDGSYLSQLPKRVRSSNGVKTFVSNLLAELFITKNLAIFASLLLAATFAPMLKQQTITGPIVNAILFASVVLLGTKPALLIGTLPSLFAVYFGFHSPLMAPLIPFIITANAILIISFSFLKKFNYWLAIISAGFLKFIFLFATSSVIIKLFIKGPVGQKLAQAMSWPQLITALTGGVIAYLFLKIFYDSKK